LDKSFFAQLLANVAIWLVLLGVGASSLIQLSIVVGNAFPPDAFSIILVPPKLNVCIRSLFVHVFTSHILANNMTVAI
jgi:hypothetical protein